MAKLPFDDPTSTPAQVLMTAITQFYPESVLGLGVGDLSLAGGSGGGSLRGQDDAGRHDLIMRPMARGLSYPSGCSRGTFMTAVALQGSSWPSGRWRR